jgi:hypothetical protein
VPHLEENIIPVMGYCVVLLSVVLLNVFAPSHNIIISLIMIFILPETFQLPNLRLSRRRKVLLTQQKSMIKV